MNGYHTGIKHYVDEIFLCNNGRAAANQAVPAKWTYPPTVLRQSARNEIDLSHPIPARFYKLQVFSIAAIFYIFLSLLF